MCGSFSILQKTYPDRIHRSGYVYLPHLGEGIQGTLQLPSDLCAVYRRYAIRRPIEVPTGFINDNRDNAMGRPVGVAIDKLGALLVADDVGNVIRRVTTVP